MRATLSGAADRLRESGIAACESGLARGRRRLTKPLGERAMTERRPVWKNLLQRGNKSRRFRVSPFRSPSGLKANNMRKLLPLLITIFVTFSHLNGEPVAVNPESVVSVHPTPPGYPVGTMIDLQNGSEIVKEPFAEVIKKLDETGHGSAR
jgi:uncharacterized protein YlzI (FlbEa/FlbD family)